MVLDSAFVQDKVLEETLSMAFQNRSMGYFEVPLVTSDGTIEYHSYNIR